MGQQRLEALGIVLPPWEISPGIFHLDAEGILRKPVDSLVGVQ